MADKNSQKPRWRGTLLLLAALAVVVVGGLIAYSALTQNAAPPESGQSGGTAQPEQPAFAFTVYDEAENAVALESLRGKPVVVNFWATWCGYCKQEMPHFQTAFDEHGADIEFMFINTNESPQVANAYLEQVGYTFPVYYDFDASASAAAGIRGLPTTLFIDSRGEIVSSKVGMMDEAALEQSIADLLEHEQNL